MLVPPGLLAASQPTDAGFDAWTIAWRILATIGLVLLNGFFVAAEFAAVSARQSRLEAIERPGLITRLSLEIKHKLDLYLSSCQLGITLASLGLGYVLEPTIVVLLEPLLAGIAPGLHLNPHAVAVAIALAIGTTLHVVVGEVAPKNWAIYHPDKLLAFLAVPLVVFTYVFYVVIWALNSLSNLLLRVLRIEVGPGAHGIVPHTVEELRALLSESVEQGAIPTTQQNILTSAFDFGDLKTRQIMTPRTVVDFLHVGQPIGDVLRVIQKTSYTRLPLCEGDMDHVIGLVHVKDLFNQLKLVPGKLRFADENTPDGMAVAIADGLPGSAVHVIGSADIDLTQIKRDVLFVPEHLPVPKLLRLFQTSHMHLAIVVDEYGATQGIVTLEDVIEEIVGDIEDEFDPVGRNDFIREGDTIRVAGLFPLHELQERLPELEDIEFEDVDTLGGYIIQQLGRWPRPGDAVVLGPWEAKVVTVQGRRIMQVVFTPRPGQEDGASGI